MSSTPAPDKGPGPHGSAADVGGSFASGDECPHGFHRDIADQCFDCQRDGADQGRRGAAEPPEAGGMVGNSSPDESPDEVPLLEEPLHEIIRNSETDKKCDYFSEKPVPAATIVDPVADLLAEFHDARTAHQAAERAVAGLRAEIRRLEGRLLVAQGDLMEAANRLKDVAADAAALEAEGFDIARLSGQAVCLHCGASLPTRKRADAAFCSSKCRVAQHRSMR